ncbi:MAG: Uma2 family endonuclease [Deefgea sp.]
MGLPQSTWISPEEYLALEMAATGGRSEYIDGEIFPMDGHVSTEGEMAMSGGTWAHNKLSGNAYIAFTLHLNGSPCQVVMNDLRLCVDSANCYFYPDVFVNCGAIENTTHTVNTAKLVVEVLSPSTLTYDRMGKFDAYRQLEDLQEYVLVDSAQSKVEVFRRGENGDWIYHAYVANEIIKLSSIDLNLAMSDLYKGVSFSPVATGNIL